MTTTLDLALVRSVTLLTQQKVLVDPEVFEALVQAAKMYAFLRDNKEIRSPLSTVGGLNYTGWNLLGGMTGEDFDKMVNRRMEKK